MSDAEKFERMKSALSWALSELYTLKQYMERPENGEWGGECRVCRQEWFDERELVELDNARQVLVACGGNIKL